MAPCSSKGGAGIELSHFRLVDGSPDGCLPPCSAATQAEADSREVEADSREAEADSREAEADSREAEAQIPQRPAQAGFPA